MNSRTSQNLPPLRVMCMLSSKLQISQSLKFLKSKHSQPPKTGGFFTHSERLAHALRSCFAGRALEAPVGTGPSSAADVVAFLVVTLAVPLGVPVEVPTLSAPRPEKSSLVHTFLAFRGAAAAFAGLEACLSGDCCAVASANEKATMSARHANPSAFVERRTMFHLQFQFSIRAMTLRRIFAVKCPA